MQHPGSPALHEKDPSLNVREMSVVVDALRAGGENIEKNPTDPTTLGGMAVATSAELSETPQVDMQQQESERNKNTSENLRTLQKRFGERFVKGDLVEGGGYTGGAARELLAGFMDRPGFADHLKRLIPSKHGALKLLKDNHSYIHATLEKQYKDDPSHEKAPVKNLYELARSVGYELTGPFSSTSEFSSYEEQDFRKDEKLCSFKNLEKYLRDYHILWLRRKDVADTLPADKLTHDTLSDSWKTYLKTIGRYDQDSDTYDLANLRPTREDPYGISSMSVKISRTGKQVYITNRYNHTVSNPDNTVDSNLDNVAYGLKRAVYSKVGREDLMDKTSTPLAEGYIADNKDGIHHYQYEEDNTYYGDYLYIHDGTVTNINRDKYYMISPQLYIPKSGKGDEIRLGQRSAGILGLEIGSDVRFLYESSRNDEEKDTKLTELRREYAERDRAELRARSIENVREQVEYSYAAYRTVAEQLGHESQSMQELEQLFAAKDKEWQANGVYDYLVEQLIESGARYNLVATPNIEASEAQIVALAEDFGKKQPYETYVYDELYCKGHYAAQEWSGSKGAAPVRFSLIPDRVDSEISNKTAHEQVDLLDGRQTSRPELNVRVPSLLDAVTYWYSLRAGGDKLVGNGSFYKTYIRHFDLEPKIVGGRLIVPRSDVRGDGGPFLGGSSAGARSDARLSVG